MILRFDTESIGGFFCQCCALCGVIELNQFLMFNNMLAAMEIDCSDFSGQFAFDHDRLGNDDVAEHLNGQWFVDVSGCCNGDSLR